MERSSSISVAVVGLGYWGPNLARNFAALDDCELRWCCDVSEEKRQRLQSAFPGTRFTADLGDLLADPELDAVVLATDVPSHARLATEVLRAGKHCFVEKPLARSAAEAVAVVDEAAAADRVLMVGHLLEYHPGVAKLKEMVDSGELGDVRYVYSNRLNLGKVREDENALWSLGAHDVSVLLHLFEEEPVEALAHGESFVRHGVEDVVFCYLRFPSGRVAHMHLSWLDPHKERRFTVVGSDRMATFDDMALERKVTIYDKGVDPPSRNYGEYITRSGDVMSPQISNEEPLRIECRHFVECVRGGLQARSGPASGLRAAGPGAGGGAGRMKHCVHPSDLAPGLMLGHDTELGDDIELGAWVVIHSGTVVGNGCVIQDGAVLGKHPRLGARSTASREPLAPLRVGTGAAVCTGAVVYAGAELGQGAIVGDQSQVRERCRIGAGAVIGRGCGLDNDVQVGDRARVQSNCYLAANAVIEEDAFVAPGVVTTNDDTMGRHAPDEAMRGPRIGRAARVGAGAVLRPGITVGEEAFVAAGAVVINDVDPRTVVMGVPARAVREVPEADLLG